MQHGLQIVPNGETGRKATVPNFYARRVFSDVVFSAEIARSSRFRGRLKKLGWMIFYGKDKEQAEKLRDYLREIIEVKNDNNS